MIDKYSNPDNGYQGYAYKANDGKIYIINSGSYDITNFENLFTGEGYKDWFKSNGELINGILPSQFYSANYFLQQVRNNYNNNSNNNIEVIGQSLGGSLTNLLGMLDENKNLVCTGFNTLGVASFGTLLEQNGFDISDTYLNISNYVYNNERGSQLRDQVGNVFKSSYNETDFPAFHNIHTHINNNLEYELVDDFPTIQSVCNILNIINPTISLIFDAVHKTICYSLKLIGSEGEKFMIYIKN